MAQLFPSHPPPEGPGSVAARTLFSALKHLPPAYCIYQNIRVLTHGAAECEMDFTIVCPDPAVLLNIECKGYGVRCTDNVWTRETSAGRKVIESPFAQAQRQVKTLLEEYEKRMRGVLPLNAFVHGHAVAFPRAEIADGLSPLEAQRPIVLLSGDLKRVEEWAKAAFAFWMQRREAAAAPLSQRDFARLHRQFLAPHLDLMETLGARLKSEHAALERRSEEQLRLYKGLTKTLRVRITGAAGTGKTALAIDAARRFARSGESVLVVCYTKDLAAHLRGVCVDDANVLAVTFHDLCSRAAEALGRAFVPPADDDARRKFWEEIAPEMLFDAVMEGKLPKVDAIIVDEGQDFSAAWATVLDACLRDAKTGRLVVFDDPNQAIFDRVGEPGFMDIPAVFELTVNFRNTRAIARTVRDLGKVDFEVHPDAPEGDKPTVRPLESKARTLARIDELVAELVGKKGIAPESIVVLTPHTRANSTLAGVRTLGGVPLRALATADEGCVRHATIAAFKGLEADVVILVDVDAEDPRCSEKARYVAASRARHLLFVFAKGEWVRS